MTIGGDVDSGTVYNVDVRIILRTLPVVIHDDDDM